MTKSIWQCVIPQSYCLKAKGFTLPCSLFLEANTSVCCNDEMIICVTAVLRLLAGEITGALR